MTTLDRLRTGQRARVLDIDGCDGVATRLLEMGLVEGEPLAVLGFALWGDPMEIEVRGYRLSLRKAEARRVRVELLDEPAASAPGKPG